MNNSLLKYDLGEGVEAFSTRRECVLPYPVVMGHQVHGCEIAFVKNQNTTREELEGFDAFVTDVPGCAIAVRTADCIPVLLHDPVRRVVAAIHSGWKGTVLGIARKCVAAMQIRYNCNPADMRAVIGPGIAVDSFQVGEEVVLKFREAGFNLDEIYRWDGPVQDEPMVGGHHIDLFAANKAILESAGILSSNIQICRIDTFRDESFFSARREGVGCGRIINVIRLK